MVAPAIALAIGVVLALVGELVLGLVVLERGEGQLSARFLGAFMLIHAVSFSILPGGAVTEAFFDVSPTDSALLVSLAPMFNALPALLLAFALTYPARPRWVQDRPWILALPFAPSAIIVALFVLAPRSLIVQTGPSNAPLIVFVFLAFLIVGALASTGLFWRRAQRAKTELEGRRLRYMAKAIAVPVALTAIVAGPVFFLAGTGSLSDALTIGALALLALVPAFGLGYGVLKYRILDLDLKIKRGIQGSTLAAVFIAVFFVASEGAQVLFAEFAGSEIVGVLAAGLLVLVLSPLQRLAGKVSDTAMPGVEDTTEHRARRKSEVYRATLEEVLADGQMSAKDRRVLLSLQESLGLEATEASRLEREILDELDVEAAEAAGGT